MAEGLGITFGAIVPFTLEELLLDENDPLIKRLLNEGTNHLSPTSVNRNLKRYRQSTWPLRHQQQCEARGENWMSLEPPDETTMQMFPGIAHMTVRQLDVLMTLGVKFPEDTPRAVDISQDIQRVAVTTESVACVSPSMELYLTHVCRTIHGVEGKACEQLKGRTT